MKIIALEEKQFAYLNHVFEQHSRAGLPANELPIASEVYLRIANATDISDDTINLGAAKVASLGPDGLTLEVDFNEEGRPIQRNDP